jgi:hypothetical protein
MGGYSDFVEVKTGRYVPRAEGLHTSCGIGVRAAYGLIYNSALYMPGRFLQGDMAVEGGEEEPPLAPDDPARLEKGPAFGASIRDPRSEVGNDQDWPVHRHDGLRSSRTAADVPAELAELWAAEAGAGPSAPIVAGGRVLAASVDEHRVSAFEAAGGRLLWSFVAGGPVRVPPSVERGLCLFGSADGYVYCLEAAGGRLVWRFRAARTERRIVARERVESTWPVESVLLRDGLACFAAGRHGQVDGGIDLYVLEAVSGKVVWHQRWQGSGYPPLLATDGKALALSSRVRFDLRTGGKAAALGIPDPACDRRAIDPSHVIGRTATLPVRLRALVRAGERVYAAGRPAEGLSGEPAILWQRPRGEPAVADAPEVHPLDRSGPAPAGWKLWTFSVDDGRKLAELKLPVEPAWDGLAAAGGRLYLTTVDGRLRCFGKK